MSPVPVPMRAEDALPVVEPMGSRGRHLLAAALALTGLSAGYLAMHLEPMLGRFDTLTFLLADPAGRMERIKLSILACGGLLSLLALASLISVRLAAAAAGVAMLAAAALSHPLGSQLLSQERGLEESLLYRLRGLADISLVAGLFLLFLAVLPTLLAAEPRKVEGALQRFLESARRIWRSMRPARRRLLLAALVFATAVILGQVVLQDFPNSSDESSYLTQARIFADGRLWVPAPPHPEFFRARSFVMDVEHGRFFAKAFPGWSALLAIFVKLGVPQILNPLLAALTVALFGWLAARLLGPRSEALALSLLAAAPFFLFNAASYFNHPLTLLLVTAFLAAVWRVEETGSARWTAAASAAAAAALTVRPASALLLTGPFVIYLAWRFMTARRGAHLAALVMPLAASVALLAFFNGTLYGSAWRSGYQAYDPGDIQAGLGPGNLMVTAWWLVKLMLWVVPGSLVGIAFLASGRAGERATPRRRILTLAAIAFVLDAVGHLIFQNKGSNEYGPRYYLDGFVYLVLLATAGWQKWLAQRRGEEGERARRGLVLSGAAALALTFGLTLPLLAYHYRDKVAHNRDLYATVRATGLKSALVFLQTGSGRMPPGDLVRNPLDFRTGIVYARDLGQESRRQLQALYPDRPALVYSYDPFRRRSHLELLESGGTR
ncbi:MAG TPA: hypothetical protein VFW45_18410 [Candidatus Polarisedimenticolia bacterium]|nr:hypothetical protein [Candidatus Polarisedimenticolia bacterium]